MRLNRRRLGRSADAPTGKVVRETFAAGFSAGDFAGYAALQKQREPVIADSRNETVYPLAGAE